MAQVFATKYVGTAITWVNRVTDVVEFSFDTNDIHESKEDGVYKYGAKQIIQDAGALDKGASMADRLRMMEKRAAALVDGTWGERTGSGVAMPNGALFAAMVKLGLIVDSDEKRAQFRKLPAKTIAALYAREDIAEELGDADEDGADEFVAN